MIGVMLVYIFKFDKNVWRIDYLRIYKGFFEIDKYKLFRVILVLFILFVVSYIVIFLKTGEIPVFAAKPWKARAEFTMFGVGLFLHNVVLIVFFSGVYFVLESGNKFRKFILILLSLISIVLYAATLQRYQIFLAIFMVVALLYYSTSRINFKTTLITGVIIVGFFYLVSSFRLGEFVIYILYQISKMKFSPDYAIFTEPYMYVVMNLENFARSITKIDSYTYGYYTFDFLTAITGIKHWISEYFYLNETPFLISSFNTYSAFWTFYRDFGVLGIFIIPFVGGISISSFYYSFRLKPTLLRCALYGMLMFGIIFSFFNSLFGFLWFIYNFLVLIVVIKYVSPDNVQY
ncbi:MAG: hypothetical protein A2V66_12735 [Ignavibacteria bacterium RBG_13_36_8]|nr:MAG: hypothetical protein A2V66_12735 [Ignavibacteria bacterium RBG_13_36_8]